MCTEHFHQPTVGQISCIAFFFSPEVGDRDGCCVDMKKHETPHTRTAGNTVRQYQLFSLVMLSMGDQEVWLAAIMQHYKRILCCIKLAWRKIKIQYLKYGFYRIHATQAPFSSQKIVSRTILSWGPSAFQIHHLQQAEIWSLQFLCLAGTPVVMLQIKRDFSDVIKVTNQCVLKQKDYPGYLSVPNVIT